jgi:hypothetical protein
MTTSLALGGKSGAPQRDLQQLGVELRVFNQQNAQWPVMVHFCKRTF